MRAVRTVPGAFLLAACLLTVVAATTDWVRMPAPPGAHGRTVVALTVSRPDSLPPHDLLWFGPRPPALLMLLMLLGAGLLLVLLRIRPRVAGLLSLPFAALVCWLVTLGSWLPAPWASSDDLPFLSLTPSYWVAVAALGCTVVAFTGTARTWWAQRVRNA